MILKECFIFLLLIFKANRKKKREENNEKKKEIRESFARTVALIGFHDLVFRIILILV